MAGQTLNGPMEQTSWLHRHWQVIAGLSAALAVIVGGFWVAMQNKGTRDYICPHINSWPAHQVVCGPEYDDISLTEAENFLFGFYNAAHRTNPNRTWQLMSDEMKKNQYGGDEDSYAAALDSVLWGELTDLSHRSGRNTFEVHVRRYSVDQRVTPQIFEVRLRKEADGDIRLVEEEAMGHDPDGRRDYDHWVVLPEPVNVHRFPRSNSPVTLEASKQGRTGGQLRALCEIEVLPGSPLARAEDAGWWTRTSHGWIRNADTTLEGETQGLLKCASMALKH